MNIFEDVAITVLPELFCTSAVDKISLLFSSLIILFIFCMIRAIDHERSHKE